MGGSVSASVVSDLSNQVVADVYTSVSLTCNNWLQEDQNISIDCVREDGKTEGLESSDQCLAAMTGVYHQYLSRYQRYAQDWKAGRHSAWLPNSWDAELEQMRTDFVKAQLQACKRCVVQDLNQSSLISVTASCKSLNSIQNKISQAVADKVNQVLSVHQDALSPLAVALGANSKADTVHQVTTRITQRLTDDVSDRMITVIRGNQNIQITGSSSNVSHVTQKSTKSAVVSFLQQLNLFNNLLSQSEIDDVNKLREDLTTISKLGNFVAQLNQGITGMIQGILGKVVIAVLAVCGVALLVGIGFVVYVGVRTLIREKEAEAAT